METPPVSIIILNFNGLEYLGSCLSSLADINYGGSIEVIVVDNASTDGSLKYLRANKNIKVVENTSNLGFAAAYNRVAPMAKHELMLFLNNDIKITPEFLTPLVSELTSDAKHAMVVPKLLDFYREGYLGGAGMICDIFGLAFNRGIGHIDRGQYDRDLYIPYGCAAAALLRKSLFLDAGAYDARYFMYHEDVDFSWRCRMMGYSIKYVPASIVYHQHMASMSKNSPAQFIYYWERNRVCTLLKNYSLATLLLILPGLFTLKILHIIYAIFSGRPKNSLAVIKAYFWNAVNITETMRLRNRVQAKRKTSDFKLTRLFKKYPIEIGLGLRLIEHPITKKRPKC